MNLHLPNKAFTIEQFQTNWEASSLKKLVFTNGCFDILHPGHISLLTQAKSFGDFLLVGLNSDASVRKLKGSTRPINQIDHRITMLSALEIVDGIIVFEEETPLKLIQAINPAVLVKGGDYNQNEIVGADFVKQNGGTVEIIPLVKGQSTTGIIEKMG